MSRDERTERWIANEVIGDSGVSTIVDSDDGTSYDVGDDLAPRLTTVASGTETIADSTTFTQNLGLSADLGGDVLIPGVSLPNAPGSQVSFGWELGGDVGLGILLYWSSANDDYQVQIENVSGGSLTVDWKVIRV